MSAGCDTDALELRVRMAHGAAFALELDLQLPHPRAHRRPFVLQPWRALSDALPAGLQPPEA